MGRKEIMRNYDWRAVQIRVRQWYNSRGLSFGEAAVASIGDRFCTTNCPRASTLIIKLRHETRTTFIILITPSSLRADLTSIRKLYRASTAWIATPGEVHRLTGSVPGCVPAFGSLFGLPVVVDTRLRDVAELFAASGRPGFAVRVPMHEYFASENPLIADLPQRTAGAAIPDTVLLEPAL